jgi:hypothetical protein
MALSVATGRIMATGVEATTMKSAATIGIVAVCFCTSGLFAQDELPMRARSIRAQRTPVIGGPISGSSGAVVARPQIDPRSGSQFRPSPVIQSGPRLQDTGPLPTPTPQLRGRRSRQMTTHRAEQITPRRSGSQAQIGNPRGNAANSSSSRHKSKKQQEKSRSGNNNTPAPSPAPPDRHQIERGAVGPTHTPFIPPTSPGRTPESEPRVSPAAPPPAAIAPPERPARTQAQPQPNQSRPQRPILNDLSEDERARLHSAHQNAIEHDPNLATSRARYLNARKEFREKLRDALLKADPSVRPILDKMHRQQNDDR